MMQVPNLQALWLKALRRKALALRPWKISLAMPMKFLRRMPQPKRRQAPLTLKTFLKRLPMAAPFRLLRHFQQPRLQPPKQLMQTRLKRLLHQGSRHHRRPRRSWRPTSAPQQRQAPPRAARLMALMPMAAPMKQKRREPLP
ncbi:MAG: hypothetical protein ACI4NA_02080 [Succinivibrio sp.]